MAGPIRGAYPLGVYANGGQLCHAYAESARDRGIFAVRTLCGRILQYPVPNVGQYEIDCRRCRRKLEHG